MQRGCFKMPPPYLGPTEGNFSGQPVPHFISPQGMLMPSNLQPPPMYGPRGATIPPKYMPVYGKPTGCVAFWCETCDRGFYTQSELDNHKREHQKCGIDGCQFIGHPLVVTNHIQQQHSSGLYDKIKNLSTPEDIAKWRDERRKRYPSKANVELRQKIQEEKIKRGEKLKDSRKRFGQMKDNNKDRGALKRKEGRKDYNTEDKRKRGNIERPKITKTIYIYDDTTEDTHFGSLPRFKGTSNIYHYHENKIKSIEKNALSSFLGMYGSDEDSEDELQNKTEKNSNSNKLQDTSNDKINANPSSSNNGMIEKLLSMIESDKKSDSDIQDYIDSKLTNVVKENTPDPNLPNNGNIENLLSPIEPTANDSGSDIEEVPFEKVTEELKEEELQDTAVVQSQESTSRHRQRKRNKKGEIKQPIKTSASIGNYKKVQKRKQNTILEKLLQSDIRHERNILLQCVRFVVENNFFNIGQN